MTQSHTVADELESVAARVDAAVAAVAKLEPSAQAVALELKQAIEAFHKLALTTMVRHLKQTRAAKSCCWNWWPIRRCMRC